MILVGRSIRRIPTKNKLTNKLTKMSSVTAKIVQMLAEKYNFDVAEATTYVSSVKTVEKKGRPKKEKVLEVDSNSDLFKKLVEESSVDSVEPSKDEVKKPMTKKAEKEAKKQAKSDAKVQKEQEKTAKAEAKLLKKQQKEAKALKEKKPRTDAQIAAFEKMKAAGEEKRKLKSEQSGSAPEAPSDAEKAVSVKRFEFNGKKYLKSSDGVLYDAESQEIVGKFNEGAQSIDFELEEEK
jgi:hypothetical protein